MCVCIRTSQKIKFDADDAPRLLRLLSPSWVNPVNVALLVSLPQDYNYFVRHLGHPFSARAPTFPPLLRDRTIDLAENIYLILIVIAR